MPMYTETIKLGTAAMRGMLAADPAWLERFLDRLPNDEIYPIEQIMPKLKSDRSPAWFGRVVRSGLPKNFVRIGVRNFFGSKKAVARAKREIEQGK